MGPCVSSTPPDNHEQLIGQILKMRSTPASNEIELLFLLIFNISLEIHTCMIKLNILAFIYHFCPVMEEKIEL